MGKPPAPGPEGGSSSHQSTPWARHEPTITPPWHRQRPRRAPLPPDWAPSVPLSDGLSGRIRTLIGGWRCEPPEGAGCSPLPPRVSLRSGGPASSLAAAVAPATAGRGAAQQGAGPGPAGGAGVMAQAKALMTKEPAPQSVPVSELPRKVCEVALNTGPDSSSGLTTSGFRTAKYLTHEWHQSNSDLYNKAFTGCEWGECNRAESKELSAHAAATTQRAQQNSTAALGQRLQDIHFWKSELQRQIEDLDAETGLLAAQKLRLERALDATAVPYAIATDNLQCRERRQPPDLVNDEVEQELLKVSRMLGVLGSCLLVLLCSLKWWTAWSVCDNCRYLLAMLRPKAAWTLPVTPRF